MSALRAWFGGTFDPIHFGHLKTAESLAEQANLQRVILLPNHIPPHRENPGASAQARAEMVRLAITDNPLFDVDTRELERISSSYTLETLKELRFELGPASPIGFIIGQDALVNIHTWFHWEELLSFCHLLVCRRPGYPLKMENPELQNWLTKHQVKKPGLLHESPSGLIWLAETLLIPISATQIRQRLYSGEDCSDLLPVRVLQYIKQKKLY